MHATGALFTLGFPADSSRNGLILSDMHTLAGSFFNRHVRMDIEPTLTLCKYAVSVLFHSPLGVLFTFPSRYSFTIGLVTYLALPVSSGRFTRAIRVPSYSRTGAHKKSFISYTGPLPSRALRPSSFYYEDSL
jgi:hypothetical protein